MATRRVVLADLPLAEKERFYEFLVANKVEFVADQSGETFVATIRVVPPEPNTARITGRAKQATKASIRRASSPPGKAKAKAKAATGRTAPSEDAAATLKAAQSVLRRRYTRFCNLLPTLTQPPKAVRRSALVRFAEEVYDARYEKDSQFIKSEAAGEQVGKLPQTFPDFVYEFAAKRYGLKSLVSNNCWGMISSVELLRGQHVGVDLFGKFVEESYDATDLLFFLFTRSAIDKVAAQAAKKTEDGAEGEEGAEAEKPKAAAKPKMAPKNPKEKAAAKAEIRLTLNQVVQIVKMAIDSKRQQLREQVIKKLDLAMLARTEGAARKAPTLEPERLLAIATEEYHNSRGLRGEPADAEIAPDSPLDFNAEGGIPTRDLPKEKDLSPEIRKEVRQVTQRLIASLSASGETDVNPQQVYEWALQVTLRRHKLGDFLDEPDARNTSMDLSGMQEAADGLSATPRAPEAFVPSDDVLNLSPEEFEKDLESNVRQLLLNATSQLIGEAISAVPGKAWQEKTNKAAMQSALISEFTPTADTLMEAIVSKEYDRWLAILKIDEGTDKHKRQFERLHSEFQQVLNSEITPQAVQQICRTVVSYPVTVGTNDEFYQQIRTRAVEMSKLGKAKKLGDSSSEEEDIGVGGDLDVGDLDAF